MEKKYFESSDYKKFKFGENNRNIDPLNKKAKIKSIEKYGLLTPIVVSKDGNYYIIHDGQHRYLACLELCIPLKCTITESTGIEHMVERNKEVRIWKKENYGHTYAKGGNKHYLLFNKFRDAYPIFGVSAVLEILSEGGKYIFETGKFIVNNYDKSIELANILLEVSKYTDAYRKRDFIIAFKSIYNNSQFDLKWFMKNLKKPKFQYIFKGLSDRTLFKAKIYEIYNDCARESNKLI